MATLFKERETVQYLSLKYCSEISPLLANLVLLRKIVLLLNYSYWQCRHVQIYLAFAHSMYHTLGENKKTKHICICFVRLKKLRKGKKYTKTHRLKIRIDAWVKYEYSSFRSWLVLVISTQ